MSDDLTKLTKSTWEFDLLGMSVMIAVDESGFNIGRCVIPWAEIDEARLLTNSKVTYETPWPVPQMSEERKAELDKKVKGVTAVIDEALQAGEDATGLCTVRAAVACMFENKTDRLEMCFTHGGRRCNVEIRILHE